MHRDDQALATMLRSRAFQVAAARSERTRVTWTLVTLAVILAVVVGRYVLFRPEGWRPDLVLTSILGAIALLYEGVMLALVQARVRRGAPIPPAAWHLNMVAETLFPTVVLLVATLMPSMGPYRALSMPAIGLYYLAIILSTLRLQPGLSLGAGAISAGGYTALVVFTFTSYPREAAAGEPLHPAAYVTAAAFMLVAGLAAAAVARQVRDHLASALREAQARQALQLSARNTLIFGLAKLAEYRDSDTGAHLERISSYTALLAEALRDEFDLIDDDWIETIRVASSMHDIGKVGIPDQVLLKPGRLTDDERRVIQRHPGLGAEALGAIHERHGEDALLRMSGEIAIGHHERWDGKGYPNGVAGEDIALAARIISVADVYDALTSARVYKPALTHAQAAQIIHEGRGTQFDPAVVDAFDRCAVVFDEVRRRHFDAGTDANTAPDTGA